MLKIRYLMFPIVLANYTLFSAVWTTFALVALALPEKNPVSLMLAAVWLVGMSWLVGGRLWRDESGPWRLLLGAVIFSSAAIVAASFIYYVYRLDVWGCAAAVILPAIIFGFIEKKPPLINLSGDAEEKTPEEKPPAVSRRIVGAALAAVAITLIAYGFGLLGASATDLAVRTPWDVAPSWLLAVFFLAAAAVAALALSGAIGDWIAFPMAGISLLAVSVAVLCYAVGYGFDPFIHQAAEAVIYREGAILPKTTYYVGQYAAVTLLARLAKVSVFSADVWLLPAVFSLVPVVAYWSLRRALALSRPAAAAAALLNLLLPLAPFIATTPQGLADVFVLLAAWLALPAIVGAAPLRALAWPVLAAAVIHPIAGLPLVAFIMMLAVSRSRVGRIPRLIALAAIFAGGALALPAAFYINSGFSGSVLAVGGLTQAPQAALQLLTSPDLPMRRFILSLDTAYFWQGIRPAAIILAAAVGAWIFSRRRPGAAVWLLGALICLVNWMLLRSAIRFPFLIEYERSNFADRLLDIALMFLLPMAAVAAAAVFRRLAVASPLAKLTTVALLAILLTSSVYLAYPRRDKYDTSRGWSTSAADVQAVRSIDSDAAGRPYVVLANQSVSAAAIREFGFRRYFPSRDPKIADPVFFYPIPTGGPLYSDFLKLNDARGAASAAEPAMDLAGTDVVYYVVTDYWWDARRIVAGAKKEAADWWNIEDRVYVFKYVRK